jgi:thiamine biosynthesis lipoprotein
MLDRVVKPAIHAGVPYSIHPEDSRPMSRIPENPFHRPLTTEASPRTFTRRRFLVSLGALAAAGVAAPLLGKLGSRVASEVAGGAAGAGRVERSRAVLGTWARIVVHHRDERLAEQAIDRAYSAIERVDAQMSVHRHDSELARVNAAAGRNAVAVSGALLEVVSRARHDAIQTNGVHDPTILPLMRLYGFYDSGRTHLPSDAEISRALALMGPQVVTIDRAAGTLGLTREGAALDLGSIGKGWAIDRAVDALQAEGVTSALVDVGRNVYGLGTPDESSEGWRVGVLHPVTGSVDRVFTLRNSAVATSGNYEQWRTLDGHKVGHLLDGHFGRPANPHLSATIHARTGLASDQNASRAFLVGAASVRGQQDVLDTHFIG